MITVGIRIYALGAVALGLVGLAWSDFALVWQPVPATVPGRTLLACALAAALLLGGLATNWRRTAAAGAALLCILFGLIAAVLHGPQVLAHPQVFGAWSGLAEQLAPTAAGLVACAFIVGGGGTPVYGYLRVGQWAFGACVVVFGLAHFFYLKDTAELVPGWLPPGQTFWAAATGVAHVAAGVSILTGVAARVAAYLLTIMFVLFGILVHAPLLMADPHSHLNWVMNAMNLALTGSAWAVADTLRGRGSD
jgi:uncharacterized membrane protein YphA (DoxX/SURF4 family)